MRNRFMIAFVAGLLGAIAMFGFVQATPGQGVASTTLAVGRFADIDATTLTNTASDVDTDFWQARIKTKGSTDVHVLENGGDVHVVRNEGSVETIVYVASLVPEGFGRRNDEPAPGNCPF